MTRNHQFPGGARFAFTVIDDTDVATVDNVLPIYRLLESLGMRTTKTVWPVRCEEGSRNFSLSETMDDPHYHAFVVDLHARGFEIAFHGATMETSTRERTARALDRFRGVFGAPPRVHANHSFNRDNLYWASRGWTIPRYGCCTARPSRKGRTSIRGTARGRPIGGAICASSRSSTCGT